MTESTDKELTVEEWRDIAGFEGRYQVSSFGSVRGLIAPNSRPRKHPKILKPTHNDRCTTVSLWVKYKCHTRLLHRLVLEAFIGPCPEGMEGSHLDGNHRNNRVDNLCWETHIDNMARMNEHGTRLRGTEVALSKLTDEIVIMCRRRVRGGEGVTRLAAEIGVDHGTLSLAVRGITWTHVPMN